VGIDVKKNTKVRKEKETEQSRKKDAKKGKGGPRPGGGLALWF